MKRFLLLACLLGILQAASGQRLAEGDRAPELKIKEWLYGAPKTDNTPRFVEFIHSSGITAPDRLARLMEIARKYQGKLQIIVISRESADLLRKFINNSEPPFFAASDDGSKTFAAYDVRYVPFGVAIDAKGRIAWFGNPESLTDEQIGKFVK